VVLEKFVRLVRCSVVALVPHYVGACHLGVLLSIPPPTDTLEHRRLSLRSTPDTRVVAHATYAILSLCPVFATWIKFVHDA